MDSLGDRDDSLKQPTQFLSTYGLEEPEIEYKSAHERCKSKVEKLLHSKGFHIAIVILCTLDGLLVIAMLLLEIETLKLLPGPIRSGIMLTSFILECTSLAIVSLFLLEIPVKIWVLGVSFYCKHWVELLDLIVCVVSFAVDVYNIQRHIQHQKHENATPDPINPPSNPNESYETQRIMHDTIADAAGLLVLFRLWRVVRIVNAIVVTVTESHESEVRHLKQNQYVAENRIRHLEQALWERGIPIPPPTKAEERFEHHARHHFNHHGHKNDFKSKQWAAEPRHISIYDNT